MCGGCGAAGRGCVPESYQCRLVPWVWKPPPARWGAGASARNQRVSGRVGLLAPAVPRPQNRIGRTRLGQQAQCMLPRGREKDDDGRAVVRLASWAVQSKSHRILHSTRGEGAPAQRSSSSAQLSSAPGRGRAPCMLFVQLLACSACLTLSLSRCRGTPPGHNGPGCA